MALLGRGKKKADEDPEEEATAVALATPAPVQGGGPVDPYESPAASEESAPPVDALSGAGETGDDEEEGLGGLENIFESEEMTQDEGFLSLVALADEVNVEDLQEGLEDLLAVMEEIDAAFVGAVAK